MITNAATQDSDDLEALFDSIVAANTAETNPPPVIENRAESNPSVTDANILSNASEIRSDKMINQIGHIARTLHNTLRELGLDKDVEKAASSITDTRDRLNYVATLTEQAAERVLNATEAAQPLLEKIEVEANRLSEQWQMLFDKKLDVERFKGLVTQTQAYLLAVPKQTKETNGYLMEIMMAQDFQDLTGQVIKKITALTSDMEQKLLELLVDNAPTSVKTDLNAGLLNGPVINPHGRTDTVTSQDQVDELLGSLGF